jgi:hypothetical protein
MLLRYVRRMSEFVAASAVARGPFRLRVWHGLAGLGAVALVSEPLWQLRFGLGSPLRALIFVALAASSGNLYRQRSLGAGRSRGLGACFLAGFVLSSTLYLALRALHAPHWSIVLVLVGFSAWGAARGAWRPMLMRPLDLPSAGAWLLALWIVGYGEWLMDGLDLTQPHPPHFIWVDTPLWLNFAYGLERGVPARELLFKGGRLNDLYGSGLLPLWLRETTGLPMHTAYASAVVMTGAAMGLMLRSLAQFLYRPDRSGRLMLLRVTPLLGALWLQSWVHNFPSLLGQALLLYAWNEFTRARRWRSLTLLIPATLLLRLTSEVCYVAFLVGAGLFAVWRLHRTRDWRLLAYAGLTLAATLLVGRPLLHGDQGVRWALFAERLNARDIWYTLAVEQVLPPYSFAALDVLAVALALASILLCWRRTTHAFIAIGSATVMMAMVGVTIAVHPQFTPPLSADEDHWVLVGMYHFHRVGSHLALLTLLCGGLVALARVSHVRRWPALSAGLLMVVALWHAEGRYNRIAQPDPEKPLGNDPILPLLERIDVRRSLVAAQLGAGPENPYWAAYFGHRFFCLRRGRWTPAYARYPEIIATQDALFAARDIGEVAALAHREGITHVIVDKLRPTPWAAQARPEVESDLHAVYRFARR